MKYMRCFFVFLVLLLFVVSGMTEAFAADTGFSTVPLSSEEADAVIKNVNVSLLTEEPKKSAINCFDVDENGNIAIGSGKSLNQTVCIYTSDGVFQYGYRFECEGTFGVAFGNGVLNIYLVRSDVALAVDREGEIRSALRISDTVENNSYWNKTVFATERQLGETTYVIKNDMGFLNVFASSYSQLAVIEAGAERLIYDVNGAQLVGTVVLACVVVLFVGAVLAVMIRQFVHLKRPKADQNATAGSATE